MTISAEVIPLGLMISDIKILCSSSPLSCFLNERYPYRVIKIINRIPGIVERSVFFLNRRPVTQKF